MHELTPDAAEALEKLAEGLPLDEERHLREFAAWATPERVRWCGRVARKVVESLVKKVVTGTMEKLDGAIPSEKKLAEQVTAQPGYVMVMVHPAWEELDDDAGFPINFPREEVLHWCRLWALIETDNMTPELVSLVETVANLGSRMRQAPGDTEARRQKKIAMSQLDHAMEGWIAQHENLERLVAGAYMLVVTEDADRALRIDPVPLLVGDTGS
jgi:hypothetical protein